MAARDVEVQLRAFNTLQQTANNLPELTTLVQSPSRRQAAARANGQTRPRRGPPFGRPSRNPETPVPLQASSAAPDSDTATRPVLVRESSSLHPTHSNVLVRKSRAARALLELFGMSPRGTEDDRESLLSEQSSGGLSKQNFVDRVRGARAKLRKASRGAPREGMYEGPRPLGTTDRDDGSLAQTKQSSHREEPWSQSHQGFPSRARREEAASASGDLKNIHEPRSLQMLRGPRLGPGARDAVDLEAEPRSQGANLMKRKLSGGKMIRRLAVQGSPEEDASGILFERFWRGSRGEETDAGSPVTVASDDGQNDADDESEADGPDDLKMYPTSPTPALRDGQGAVPVIPKLRKRAGDDDRIVNLPRAAGIAPTDMRRVPSHGDVSGSAGRSSAGDMSVAMRRLESADSAVTTDSDNDAEWWPEEQPTPELATEQQANGANNPQQQQPSPSSPSDMTDGSLSAEDEARYHGHVLGEDPVGCEDGKLKYDEIVGQVVTAVDSSSEEDVSSRTEVPLEDYIGDSDGADEGASESVSIHAGAVEDANDSQPNTSDMPITLSWEALAKTAHGADETRISEPRSAMSLPLRDARLDEVLGKPRRRNHASAPVGSGSKDDALLETARAMADRVKVIDDLDADDQTLRTLVADGGGLEQRRSVSAFGQSGWEALEQCDAMTALPSSVQLRSFGRRTPTVERSQHLRPEHHRQHNGGGGGLIGAVFRVVFRGRRGAPQPQHESSALPESLPSMEAPEVAE